MSGKQSRRKRAQTGDRGPGTGDHGPESGVRSGATRLESLAGLRDRLAKPLFVRFELDGELIELPLRRMRPQEVALVHEKMNEAIPPMYEDEKDGQRYDLSDEGYLKKKRQSEREARSMTVFFSLPGIWPTPGNLQDAAPNVPLDQMHQLVMNDSALAAGDSLVQLIFNTAISGGVTQVARQADFF